MCQAADRSKLFLLQDPQQLHLHLERQLANLVEECGAAVCGVQKSQFLVVAPVKAPFA